MIKKYLKRFPHAIRGIFYAITNDSSYRHQVYIGGVVTTVSIFYFNPLEAWELLFIVLAWILILITELQNSSLEAALDRIHPELHDGIKRSKDMAAGAVLTAGLFLLFVLLIISYNRLPLN